MGVQVSEIDYYSLHGMWGAYASFAIGRIGQGAGVVIGNVQPPERGLFVGYRRGRELPRLLPFVPNRKVGLSADSYVDPTTPARPNLPPPEYRFFEPKEIERVVSFSGETWNAGLLSMSVFSFFGEIPDPTTSDPVSSRAFLRPAVYVKLSFDNSKGAEGLVGIFGMQGIRRCLSDGKQGTLLGFAHGTDWGFATLPGKGIDEVMDWQVIDAAFDANRPLRRLASEGALRFNVGAGEKREYVIAIAVYRDGVITAGRRTHGYHTSLFHDLEDVLECALENAGEGLAKARALDTELDRSSLSEDRKFLLAHGVHSYCANTELLLAENGEAVFVVNEGEYQMMNTLDLTVDQAFFELRYSPWTLRNELDNFLLHSSYNDAYGLAFSHDQGVADCFSPAGSSAYELPKLSECFSYMSFEETLNWGLSACLYLHSTEDRSWYEAHREVFGQLVSSIRSRDKNSDGIMDTDSDRCASGAEITTYDSLDVSLGQARNNLYLGVKTWGILVSLASLFSQFEKENPSWASAAQEGAELAAETLVSHFIEEEGYIPAVFENGNRSKIIPAIEGLAYPFLCGAASAVQETGPYGKLIQTLKKHLQTVLVPEVCLDPISGGWKLSSTSRNTWLSKIFLNQFVAEEILGIRDERTQRDGVHALWLRQGSAQWAATDQVDSRDGRDLGSRLYPRLVTSILWLKSTGNSSRTFHRDR